MPTDIQQNLETIEAVLQNDPAFIDAYPHLFKVINRIVRYLYDFLAYAAEKKPIGTKSQQFFVSSRHLATRCGYGSFNTWNRNINIYVTVGLIRRVRPDAVLIDYKRGKDLKPINFYTVPQYTDKLLKQANRTAKKLIDHNFRLNAFSKIYLIKVFGRVFANRVYPDERGISEYSEYVAGEIEKFIMRDLEQNGYTTKDRILEGVQINTADLRTQEYGFHRSSLRNILSKEFDRSITDICEKYELMNRRANKELMDKFALESYKNIIYQE